MRSETTDIPQPPAHRQSSTFAGMQGSVDPVYLAAANYLKSIGFTNTAEIARVLDIAMNPNSLFVRYNDAKRSTNVNVSSAPPQ